MKSNIFSINIHLYNWRGIETEYFIESIVFVKEYKYDANIVLALVTKKTFLVQCNNALCAYLEDIVFEVTPDQINLKLIELLFFGS